MSRRHVCGSYRCVCTAHLACDNAAAEASKLGTSGRFDPGGFEEAAKGRGYHYIEQSGTRRTKEMGIKMASSTV